MPPPSPLKRISFPTELFKPYFHDIWSSRFIIYNYNHCERKHYMRAKVLRLSLKELSHARTLKGVFLGFHHCWTMWMAPPTMQCHCWLFPPGIAEPDWNPLRAGSSAGQKLEKPPSAQRPAPQCSSFDTLFSSFDTLCRICATFWQLFLGEIIEAFWEFWPIVFFYHLSLYWRFWINQLFMQHVMWIN